MGVYGDTSTGLAGVFGISHQGQNYGVFGQSEGIGTGVKGYGRLGVEGVGTSYGVVGNGLTGVFGFGSDYGVYSQHDLGIENGHIISIGTDVASACSVLASTTSRRCTFLHQLPTGTYPAVIVTPTSNPQTFFWVSNGDPTGFTLNIGAPQGSDANFVYLVVGVIN